MAAGPSEGSSAGATHIVLARAAGWRPLAGGAAVGPAAAEGAAVRWRNAAGGAGPGDCGWTQGAVPGDPVHDVHGPVGGVIHPALPVHRADGHRPGHAHRAPAAAGV